MRNSVLCYLEETVRKYPEKMAVIDKDSEINFHDLRHNALCIADSIIEKNIPRYSPVFVYLPKSIMSIAAFMGTLYSGNIYTPTDVRFPFEKAKSIIDCLNPELIITDKKSAKKLISGGISQELMIFVEDIDFRKYTCRPESLLNKIIDTDPVYTFFTSGSTGVPKGVTITNRNVIDYTDWAVSTFNINEKTIMGNQSPFYFDISTQDIYACISTGATLAIIPETYFIFPVKALQWINEKKINFLYWVPSAFVNISTLKLLEKIRIDNVDTIMFGGEVMPVKHLNYWRKYLPNLKLIANVYGPTEATVNCTYYIVDREFDDTEVLPLGKACENTDLLVLDDENTVISAADTNKVGELCVRGSSLSVGYWDSPEKTEQMYVQNPLNKHYPELIYKTGDLVFYNERGELVFTGRKDFQIKHMGYRIELGEIEAASMGVDGIESTCAIYDNDKKQIILFYTGSADLMDSAVSAELSRILPKYMVPAVYYKLNAMPHNDNGKTDRKALKAQYIGE